MPARFRISAEHDLCLLEVWGSTSDRDMLKTATRIWDDERWHPGMSQINDFRHLEEMVVELDEMRAFIEAEADRVASYDGARGRVAVVVANDIHESGMKLYAALARNMPHDTRIFPTIKAAAEWIGVDPREVWPGYEREPLTER